ncbi:hypothetical protein [Rhizobium sp. EC-SD404]|uniref:hypothetical protein n=1 Tax=Rhizobium sp. EC-SD404 TaxID=2038389 RepID=UPI001258B361|nr:hypothetical protein [Rhizobium sp. EC-SD404]VVT04852.1 hypothetical protein RHIZ404_200300 [Rhizobium sp. EC-SD404]
MYTQKEEAAVACRMKPVFLLVVSSKIMVLTLLSASLFGFVDLGVEDRPGIVVHAEIAAAQ